MDLLGEIDRHLAKTRIPPTRFGRLAMRDPRLVGDLRRGRRPGAATIARVQAYMASAEAR